jgi:hypothetical protein
MRWIAWLSDTAYIDMIPFSVVQELFRLAMIAQVLHC